jgi:hypothetical protein
MVHGVEWYLGSPMVEIGAVLTNTELERLDISRAGRAGWPERR